MIRDITFETLADWFAAGDIEQTIDVGHAIAHVINIGTKENPCRHLVMSDASGNAIATL